MPLDAAGIAAPEAPPFPADRRTLVLGKESLAATGTATVRFMLENSGAAGVLHVRIVAASAPWVSVVPSEVGLSQGARQQVLVLVDCPQASLSLRSGGPAGVVIQLAYQYLYPVHSSLDHAPVGTDSIYLRLPGSTCPRCQRVLQDDAETGRTPDICPYCFERLRECPVCGAPNSWLSRECVFDPAHVVRGAIDWPVLGRTSGHTADVDSAGTSDGQARLTDATAALSLSRRWSFPGVPPLRREQAFAWSAPVAAYGMVIAAAATSDGDAHVYGFQTSNGAPLWEPYPLTAPVYPDRGGVAIAAGRLFSADVTGVITALDVLRGTRLWETRLDGAPRVYGAVLPHRDLLLAAATSADGVGKLFRLDSATGRVVGSIELPGSSDTAPAAWNEWIFVHTDRGILVCLDVVSGAIRWSAVCSLPGEGAGPRGFDAAPVVADGKVFSADVSGTVWCHDADTGSRIWSTQATNAPFAGTPAYDGTLLFVPADDGVHAISGQTGRAVRRYPTRQPVRSAPVVVGGRTYFGCTDGALYGAVPGGLLERLYEASAGAQIVAATAVVDGAMYVSATNGVLYVLNM